MTTWEREDAINVGEVRLDVGFLGPSDGESIVLLHGFPESREQWARVAPLLADAGYRVIAPNLRGYSRQARPSDASEYSIDHLVGDVIGLLDALDLGQAHLVAHDWGGTIGWFVAVRHPERVRTFTAVSTAHPRAVLDAIATDTAQRDAMQYIKSFRAAGAEERFRRNSWRELRVLCHDLPDEAFAAHAPLLDEPGAFTGALNYYRGYDPRSAGDLAACTVPTAYVWSTEDFAFRRSAALATARHVSGPYAFVELEGVGHWISDLQPHALVDAVRARIESAEHPR